MDDNGETREDLRVPDGDFGKDIEKKFNNGEQFMVRQVSLLFYIFQYCIAIVAFLCSQTINIYRFALISKSLITKYYLLKQATTGFMQLLQLI